MRKPAEPRSTRQWPLSLALLALFLGVGWSSLPADLAGAQGAMRLRDQRAPGANFVTQVFVLRPDGSAVRFGNAEMEAAGFVRVGVYDPLDPLLVQATAAVSLPGDARLLWLLAAPQERQTLRDKVAALVLGLSASVDDIARSPIFQSDYRDPLLQILRNAMQAAWQAARDNGAWQDLLRSYEPILRGVASRELRPIIERHFQGVALRMLRANTLTIIDPFHHRPWNTEPIEQALEESIDEIRDRHLPEQTAMQLLDTPQSAAFVRAFIGVAGEKLAHDVALQDLIAQMVYDPRLRRYMDPAIDRLLDLGRTAPRLLVNAHASADLNLAAAAALRTMISGRPDRIVVLMSPRQRDELMALDPIMVHALTPLGRTES